MENLELNKIYHGDCLDLMNRIPDKSIDMIFADLPFETTNASWDCMINLPRLWNHYERIIKDNGAILLNAQSPFDKILGCSNLKLLRYEWIWEKTHATGHFNAKKMPMKAHENILVFYKKLPTYNPQMTEGHEPSNTFTKKIEVQNKSTIYNNATREIKGGGKTDRYPRSVQVFASDKQKSNLHECQKPEEMCDYFIRTYSNEGDVILDNSCGSGTMGFVAKKLKRNFIMMDNVKEIFEVACKRLGQEI